MPELPDITVYVERLHERIAGRMLRRVQLLNPFVLRTALPSVAQCEEQEVTAIERLGKRIVLALASGRFIVIHLMIAGRLRWLDAANQKAKAPARTGLAAFSFDNGQLVLTEAGTVRRASIHLLADRAALQALDPGGIDVMTSPLATFAARLQRENHTLKRSLIDPRLFSGIGNAYGDEILHRAGLSPVALSRALDAGEVRRLFEATRAVLFEWTERLRAEAIKSGGWPEKVTAFHPEMAVHGRFGQPCPACAAPVQRIVHGGGAPTLPAVAAPRGGADGLGAARRPSGNETNYCPRCQTGSKVLADRSLSRLLKASWPRHVDEL